MLLDDLTSPGAQTADRAEMEAEALTSASSALETFLNRLRRDALRTGQAPTLGEVLGSWATVVDTLVQDLGGDEETRARLLNSSVPIKAHGTASATLAYAAGERMSKAATRREMYEALDPATGSWERSQDGLELRGINWQAALDAIVRTEATAAQGRISLAATREKGYLSKMWVARHDSKTRPAHLYASGQTVPVDQDFIVGGYVLAYPGDPTAPPELTWNCRCVLVAAGEPSSASAPTLDEQLAAQVPDPDMPLADRVRLAVLDLAGEYGEYTSMEALRERFRDVPRSEMDATLRSLFRERDVVITEDVDQRLMSAERRAAAVRIGGAEQHLIKILSPEQVAEEDSFLEPEVKPLEGDELATSLASLPYGQQGYSEEQVAAVEIYQGAGYTRINQGLRGQQQPSSEDEQLVREIDQVIDSSPPLAAPALVYRGLGAGANLPSEGSLVGHVIRDKAFASVTIKEIMANKFLKPRGVLLEIVLPAGTKVAPVNLVGKYGFSDGEHVPPTAKIFNTYEGELLLPRGTQLRIISEERRDWGSFQNIRVIRAEVIL